MSRFEKNSILLNFFWLRAAKGSPLLSEKIWTFVVDRLTVRTENNETFSKKSFSDLCYQTDSYKFKTTYKRARILNAETGKLILLSKFQQSFINKFSQSCVLGVQWSFFWKKILGVFQDSERNLSWWFFQTSYCTSLNAHLRRSFSGKTFPIEILWFQDALFWLVLSKVTWTSHVNRFFRKKWCATFEKKLIQEVAFRYFFARVLARICLGKNFSEFHVF